MKIKVSVGAPKQSRFKQETDRRKERVRGRNLYCERNRVNWSEKLPHVGN